MSIFPKRTLPGSTVTIHWNFNTAALKHTHIYPYVRIGVRDTQGQVTMLMEQHVLALPPVSKPAAEAVPKSVYLNKNTPLLVLADYLSGAHKKEVLAEILQHIEDGRHYYFTYQVPAGAPPGKYTLLSELYNEGNIKYSRTAADDFFFVESVALIEAHYANGAGTALVANQSPEKTPVRLVEYLRGRQLEPERVTAFELLPMEQKLLTFSSPCSFLFYNEERKVIPLWPGGAPAVLRNQQLIQVTKEHGGENIVFLLGRDKEEGITITGSARQIWEMADGLTPNYLLQEIDSATYAEMLATGLLHEINL